MEIKGYIPGAIGRITELHAIYYSKQASFNLYFESKVATEMSEFLTRFNPDRDGFWIAYINGQIVGSIVIDGIKSNTEGLHLRWFIVSPNYQGRGIGTRLLESAIGFCRKVESKRVYLWTFSGLDAARHLYEKFGFILREEITAKTWGKTVKEQLFELLL